MMKINRRNLMIGAGSLVAIPMLPNIVMTKPVATKVSQESFDHKITSMVNNICWEATQHENFMKEISDGINKIVYSKEFHPTALAMINYPKDDWYCGTVDWFYDSINKEPSTKSITAMFIDMEGTDGILRLDENGLVAHNKVSAFIDEIDNPTHLIGSGEIGDNKYIIHNDYGSVKVRYLIDKHDGN